MEFQLNIGWDDQELIKKLLQVEFQILNLPVSAARTSFNTLIGHSFRLLCVGLILCLLSNGVSFWKYNSDGRNIACGELFF